MNLDKLEDIIRLVGRIQMASDFRIPRKSYEYSEEACIMAHALDDIYDMATQTLEDLELEIK